MGSIFDVMLGNNSELSDEVMCYKLGWKINGISAIFDLSKEVRNILDQYNIDVNVIFTAIERNIVEGHYTFNDQINIRIMSQDSIMVDLLTIVNDEDQTRLVEFSGEIVNVYMFDFI